MHLYAIFIYHAFYQSTVTIPSHGALLLSQSPHQRASLPLRRDLWYHFLDFQHWSRILLAIAERQVQIPEGPANVYRGNKSVLSRGDGKISWKEGRHHHVTDELI